jgi:antitoxin ParD1/3/4
MRDWVEEQVENGGFGTASEYIRQLLRAEQQRQLREQIDANLLRALDSGEPVPAHQAFWQQRSDELAKRLKQRKKKKA